MLPTASNELHLDLLRAVRDVSDFPIPGVVFKDFGPVWANTELNRCVIDEVAQRIQASDSLPRAVAGIESRGFIYGMAIATSLGVPFLPLRKAGKLPGKTHRLSYQLEYGRAELECQDGVIPANASVLIHDDVLATGGTACAAGELVELAGAKVWGFSFLLNLKSLDGFERLKNQFPDQHFHTLLNIE